MWKSFVISHYVYFLLHCTCSTAVLHRLTAGNMILCEPRIKCGVQLLVRVKFGNKLIKFDVHVTVHRDKFL